MRKELIIPFLVYMASVTLIHIRATCPHLEAGLLKWSEASTWVSKPVTGDEITISKKILLDESPPKLGSITIAAGGALVWADKDNITLSVSYLLINGRFQIGSETCKFSKKATIVLTGKSDSPFKVSGFGRKFVGVGSGGILELHGEDKLSWTKLGQTLPAARHTCGIVYDHKKTLYDREWATGIHAIVWNLDGSLYDFEPFVVGEVWEDDVEKLLVKFLNGIPKDKVVALAVHQNLGVKVKPTRDWNLLFQAVETLGGIASGKSLIRNVKDKEAYAFITIKGKPVYTVEQHVPLVPGEKYTITDDVHITMWENKLKFWVESAVKSEGDWSIPNDVDFRVLSTEVAYPKIEVIDEVNTWLPGDRVVFTSTDFDWRQAEVFTVMACSDCASNQFRVDGMFENNHFGQIFDNVDERGEVALLTRNILIKGQMEAKCYGNTPAEEELCDRYTQDVFGGHLKITRGFAAAHIEGVEFHNMGQASFLGSYPVHFHMCDDAAGAWIRKNSIHHSFARCVTIHGTDNTEISDNVCYKHMGHGFFFEDSSEQGNKLDGNIGIGTEHGNHILSDFKSEWCDKELKRYCDAISTFWITHPNNTIINNVAAGSDKTGFWFLYADKPLGPSAARQKARGLVTEFSTRYTPITEFRNNVAHSNANRGLIIDSRISTGEMEEGVFVPETGILSKNEYDPRIPNNKNGKQAIVYLDRLTAYKNRGDNVWLRGGNLVLQQSSIADSTVGLTMAMSSDETFTEVKKTVFVGVSDNIGMPQRWTDWDSKANPKPQHQFDGSIMGWTANEPLQGFVFYDGPNFVTDCHFNRYNHWRWNETLEKEFPGLTTFRSGGALSWRLSNILFFDPQSKISGTTFGFCDETEGNKAYDGNATVPGFEEDGDAKLQAIFRDEDGSVTGHAGSYVVKNVPFFTSRRCTVRQNWQMAVCPHTYAKVHFFGVDFVKGKYPLVFIRDDAYESPFSMDGGQGIGYHMMKNKTFTIHFNETVPKTFQMYGHNMERGDFLRIGLCYPKDMKSFTITSWYPYINEGSEPAVEVKSIKELDDDLSGKAYFWDRTIGLLFLKLRSNETRTGWRACPNDRCPDFKITKHDGGDKADCRLSAYGPYKKDQEPSSTEMKKPECKKTDAQDRGAGSTRQATSSLSNTPFTITCPMKKPVEVFNTKSLARGCYVDKWVRDMSGSETRLYESMTRGDCIKRCFQKGYLYAGLQNGEECRCDDSFGMYGGDSAGCTKPCKGNTQETCGGVMRNEVFATGNAPHQAFPRCGPGSRGIIVDNACYYLGEDKLKFMDALRACGVLGGQLASIRSQNVQDAVKSYISRSSGNVWFGLTDVNVEGTFEFLDGTAITAYSNFHPGAPFNWWGEQDYGILDEEALYKWTDRGRDDQNRYLCELPASAPVMDIVSCGQNHEGRKFGTSGNCYAVINRAIPYEDAKYQCYSKQGIIAPIDAKTTQEILFHLHTFGLQMDYWVGGPSVASKYPELIYQKLFRMKYADSLDKNGVVCLIETLSLAKPCPTGWKHNKNSCYLYTGKTVQSYELAAGFCNSGSSSILTVESKEENDFVFEMVKMHESGSAKPILLGLTYSPYSDTFDWLNGTPFVYSDWAQDQGLKGISKGRCVKIESVGTAHQWQNTQCIANLLAVVCKTNSFNSV